MNKIKIFTKSQRTCIWLYYVNNILRGDNSSNFDLTQAAPCPYCGEKMLKVQFQESQPNQSCSWAIDHIDGDLTNNYLNNLWPMHPWCISKKTSRTKRRIFLRK